MASRDAKPAGTRLVPAGGEPAFLHPKPVRALWGVGEATFARLEELGVATIGDLAAVPRATLVRRLGEALGAQLADLAGGIDPRPITPSGPHRSLSVEETFARDLVAPDAMRRRLLAQADRLAGRMRRAGVVAGTVVLKVRYGDFTTITRSQTSSAPVTSAQELYEAACSLLDRTDAATRPVRLLGLGIDGLAASVEPRQLGLTSRRWDDVDAAIDGLRDRFGPGAVGRARLLDDEPRTPGTE